jgi:hypothetical protein
MIQTHRADLEGNVDFLSHDATYNALLFWLCSNIPECAIV